jgi:hypothetical protein
MGYIAHSSIPDAIAPIPIASLPFITTMGRSLGSGGMSMRKSRCSLAQAYPSRTRSTLLWYTASDFLRKVWAIWSSMRDRSRS